MAENELDSWFNEIEADLAATAAKEQDYVYIYEDDDGGIIAITPHVLPEYEGLYTRKVWNDAPEAEQESNGLVYYDRAGTIRVVCFHPSEEFARQYDCASIPRDLAEQLSSGELSTDDWIIGYTTTDRVNPKLLPRNSKNRLVKLVQRDGWAKISDERPQGSAILLMRIGVDERKFMLRLMLSPGVELASDVEDFTVLFTAPEDMATIYQGAKVKMADLLSGDLIFPLGLDPSQPYDVYVPDIFDGVQRQSSFFVSNLLPLPQGHFSDVVRVPWETEYAPGLVVAVYRDERKIQFEFDKKEGTVYDRDLNDLPVLFTIRDNPGYLLHTARVSFYHLIQTGFLDIDIPDHLVTDRFDIMLPMVFENMVMKDRFVVGKNIIDEDWYEVPLTFEVPDRVALTATPNEDTNEIIFEVKYEHEAQEGIIFGFEYLPFVMARRGDLSEFYERFQVPVEPLMRDGRVAVEVRTDVKLDFGLWTKRIFKSCKLVR